MTAQMTQIADDVADMIDRFVVVELTYARIGDHGMVEWTTKGRLLDVGAIGQEITDVVVERADGVVETLNRKAIAVVDLDRVAEHNNRLIAAGK